MEKCNEMRKDLTLPSGCYLVNINLLKCLYDRICMEKNKTKLDNSDCLMEEDNNQEMIKFNEEGDDEEDSNSISNDLIMDVLPQSTRFTTTSTLDQLNEIGIDFNQFENDLNDDDTNWDDSIDFNETQYKLINLYVQKNSRLRLVLLSNVIDCSSDIEINDIGNKKDIYHLDNFVRIVNHFCFIHIFKFFQGYLINLTFYNQSKRLFRHIYL